MSVKYAFIRSEEGNYPIASMCRWAGVSRSGYHAWRVRKPSWTARWRRELAELVRFSFDRSEETYGYRRVHADLQRWGYAVHPETVRSIMRELGLVPCQPKPWRPVTTVAGDASGVPDLVNRDFTAAEPAAKLVGDITCIRTWEGFLYLATVLDCYSKKIVGYAMADHMRTSLVTDALDMAAGNGHIRREITIFHSDRGTQYMSDDFAKHARKLGFLRSVGRTGVCWDNAWAESLNGTLKNELTHRKVYATREQARFDIARWIELWYNHNRLHSGLGYRTPNEVEEAWHMTQNAA